MTFEKTNSFSKVTFQNSDLQLLQVDNRSKWIDRVSKGLNHKKMHLEDCSENFILEICQFY